jgi:hypothetical protein
MRRTILALLVCLPALGCVAAEPPEGRWEGPIPIPGKDLQMVVDLAQDSAGAWIGSITIPGLGIKGEALQKVATAGSDLTFEVGGSMGSAIHGPAGFKAHLTSADAMVGELKQGGNVAKFALARVASAQVEIPQRSTRIARDVEDQWTGDIELGGYPRHITITLTNHADAAATAKFVIVGKQTTDLPVDLVVEEGNFVRIASQAGHVAFEGRFVKDKGEIKGVIEMGPIELPLVLRRVSTRSS